MNLHFLTLILLIVSFPCFGEQVKVYRIIDGDTFESESGEKVRLIGINAPEISDIYGQESKYHLSELIENNVVELVTDNFSNDRDRYNRLLRYVILDGVDINKKMVLDGFAFAYLKYNFEKSYEYEQAQITSKERNQGIWNNGEEVSNEKQEVKLSVFEHLSKKQMILCVLVIFLFCIGIYSYFKK